MKILSKKHIHRLGSTMNESAGSEISSFAKKQMIKMGWIEGSGLGKNKDGISTHIKVSLRTDNEGISSKEEKDVKVEINGHFTSDDNWWHSAYQHGSKKFKRKAIESSDDLENKITEGEKKEKKKRKKLKKEKKEKKKSKIEKLSTKNDTEISIPTFEELFQATGGARLGMRARMKQVGKISRTEG